MISKSFVFFNETSTAYIGKWQIIMLDKAGGGVNKPEGIHVVISAQGF